MAKSNDGYLSNWRQGFAKAKFKISAEARFWNLFRSDLMRLPPDNLTGYLTDKTNRITQVADGNLAECIRNEFKGIKDDSEREEKYEALIVFCLERDAALKFAEFESDSKKKYLGLKKKLDVMEV